MSTAGLIVLAAEGISPSSPIAQLAAPLGILIFLGSTYMLLRANLGTKRGYFVLATSLFGFLFLISLFWGYGAPGTPQATGPTNLPGQAANTLQAKWVPFAIDSTLADRADLQVVKSYPEGFSELPAAFEDQASSGTNEIQNFFSAEPAGEVVGATAEIEAVRYAPTSTGLQLIAVEFAGVEETEDVEAIEPYTAFGYYDEGTPLLPSWIMAGLSFVLFLLHAWLLDRDERLERRDRDADATTAPAERERVAART